MKRNISATIILITFIYFSLLSVSAAKYPKRGKIKLEAIAAPAWWTESMKGRDERLKWYKEAKFGMFVHWNASAVLGGEWKGNISGGYSEHIMSSQKIPVSVYRDEVVAKFNPLNFDADKWIATCKDAGMKYFVITAKHHDGFALWDSAVSENTIPKITGNKRDYLAELKQACAKYGIKFGFYYSHAQDWESEFAAKNTWDYPDNPPMKFWNTFEKYQSHLEKFKKYIDGKSIPQVIELIDRYDPDIIWFDTATWAPSSECVRVLEAARKRSPNLVVNSRILAGRPKGVDNPAGFGDYKSTNDRPLEFQNQPELDVWEGIPTTNESYGYHKHDKSHKPSEFFIKLLIKAAEKGGNLLMNIGPKPDGTIDEPDLKILEGIGKWMDINGESIWGSQRSPLPLQAWGHVTRKDNKLYLHVINWPINGEVELSGLVNAPENIYLLSDKEKTPLEYKTLKGVDANNSDWIISAPKNAPDKVSTVIVLDFKDKIETRKQRILLSNKVPYQRLHVFDGEISSAKNKGIKLGSGNPKDNYAYNWTNKDDYISWKVRVLDTAKFDMGIVYNADKNMGGKYKVSFLKNDDSEFISISKDVEIKEISDQRNKTYIPKEIGAIELEPAEYTIKLSAQEINNKELMLPTELIFKLQQ